MYLSRHQTLQGARWALDGHWLAPSFRLGMLLELEADRGPDLLRALLADESATGSLLAPIEADQEVWASGVTYLRSREARVHESDSKDIYEKVYEAERPELFFKAIGWRVVGHEMPIRVRVDAHWNVPEPELALVINRFGQVVGYCVGNDVSSRDIEGANPLYLPQAKIYNGCCSLGPGIRLAGAEQMRELPISMEIARAGETLFQGETSTAQMKRAFEELAEYQFMELVFPQGMFLLTGAGIVPEDNFNLQPGDTVLIRVGQLTLINPVGH